MDSGGGGAGGVSAAVGGAVGIGVVGGEGAVDGVGECRSVGGRADGVQPPIPREQSAEDIEQAAPPLA